MDDRHLDHSMTNLILKMVGVGTGSPALFGSAMKMAHPATKLFTDGGPNAVEPMYDGGKIDYVPKITPKLIHGWVDSRDVPRPVKAKNNFRHWYKHHQPVSPAPIVKKEGGPEDE